MTYFPLPNSTGGICSAKKLNSSFSFSSTCRNSFQFFGTVVKDWTRRRIPHPLFSLVIVFKLFGTYSSHMMSSLCTCCSWPLIQGMNTRSVYSWNVFTVFVGVSMLIASVPSIIVTSIGVGALVRGSKSDWMQFCQVRFLSWKTKLSILWYRWRGILVFMFKENIQLSLFDTR